MIPIMETSIQVGPTRIVAAAALGPRPTTLVQEYLMEHLQTYRGLSEEGDAFFQQRNRADNVGSKGKKKLFRLMHTIGLELHKATSAHCIDCVHSPHPRILDLCVVSGSFTLVALSRNPSALVRAISLPPAQGGHDIMLRKPWPDTDPNAQIFVDFRDITMLMRCVELSTHKSEILVEYPRRVLPL